MTKKKENGVSEFDFREITSFEKACEAEKIDSNQLPGVENIPEEFREPLKAVYRLMVAHKAVNKGWTVDYEKVDQRKYCSWAWIKSSGSGFVFSRSGTRCNCTYTVVGSHLLSDSHEKESHIFEHFKNDYLIWYTK